MESVVSLRIPKKLEMEIDAIVKLGLFKDRSEFIRFAIVKTLLEIWEKIPFKEMTIDEIRDKLKNKLMDEDKIVEFVKRCREKWKKLL